MIQCMTGQSEGIIQQIAMALKIGEVSEVNGSTVAKGSSCFYKNIKLMGGLTTIMYE